MTDLVANFASVIAIIKDLAVMFAAVTGGVVAIIGLKAWKRELRGKTNYDLARRTLRSALRVRDAISAFRNPMITPAEFEAALRESGFDNDAIKEKIMDANAHYAVRDVRWNRIAEAASDLQSNDLEIEVLWGEGARNHLMPLYDCVNKLFVAAKRHSRDEQGKRHLPEAEWARIDAIVYRPSEDPSEDAFGKEVQDAIDYIREFVKPHLEH